jgi:hypothetical protein
LLAWLKRDVAIAKKLHPPGLILHTTRKGIDKRDTDESSKGLADTAFVVGVDPVFFDALIFSGTSMVHSHLPVSYSDVLLGDCKEPRRNNKAAATAS